MDVLVKLISGEVLVVKCTAFDILKDALFFVDEKQMCLGAIPSGQVVYAIKQEAVKNYDQWLEPQVVNVGQYDSIPVRPKDEKTTMDIFLVKISDSTKKIAVIKSIRELTGLCLKEAKDIVDQAPRVVKAGILTDDAWAMKKRLETDGAIIELK